MQKLTVKARKLQMHDTFQFAGTTFRVTTCNLHFGGPGTDKVTVYGRTLGSPSHVTQLRLCPDQKLNIKRPNKKK